MNSPSRLSLYLMTFSIEVKEQQSEGKGYYWTAASDRCPTFTEVVKMSPPGASVTSAGWLCVFLAVASANSGITLYKKVGDEVILKPDTTQVTGAITNIIWKYGPNIAIQWDQGMEADFYRHFKVRGGLNISNGEMTITGLTRNDSGKYTPEINSVIKDPVELIVISPVPKPTATASCDEEVTRCTLTCDGDATDAELVTYRWKSGDKVAASSKEHHITKDDDWSLKELTCELENPVSRESSQPIPNPLAQTKPKPNISTGVTVFIALLIAVLLLVAIHRCKAGMWFYQKTSMPWQADFWRKHKIEYKYPGTSEEEEGHANRDSPMTQQNKTKTPL